MDTLGNITITAAPEVLLRQAQAVQTRIGSIEQHFQRIAQTVNASGSYWNGDAGTVHRQVYQESKEGIEEVLSGFRETAEALETIARNYETTENTQVTRSAGLPSDVIS